MKNTVTKWEEGSKGTQYFYIKGGLVILWSFDKIQEVFDGNTDIVNSKN